jgi:transposase
VTEILVSRFFGLRKAERNLEASNLSDLASARIAVSRFILTILIIDEKSSTKGKFHIFSNNLEGFEKLLELHSQKTDKADAGAIAKYCMTHDLRLWQPQPKEYRQPRNVCRAIDSLKSQLVQQCNKLEARLINDAVKVANQRSRHCNRMLYSFGSAGAGKFC